jgi:hypothetical protein
MTDESVGQLGFEALAA